MGKFVKEKSSFHSGHLCICVSVSVYFCAARVCVQACLQSLVCIVNLHVYARMHAPGAAPLCLFLSFHEFLSFLWLCMHFRYLRVFCICIWMEVWKFRKFGCCRSGCSVFCVLYSDMRTVGVGWRWLLYSCFSFSRRCRALEPDVGGRRFFLYCIVAFAGEDEAEAEAPRCVILLLLHLFCLSYCSIYPFFFRPCVSCCIILILYSI